MIADACAELGERALIYSGTSGSALPSHPDHVKLVGPVNYTSHLSHLPRRRPPWRRRHDGRRPASRTPHVDPLGRRRSVHLGNPGQPTESRPRQASFDHHPKSLVRQLRNILAPDYVARAREIATRMTKPTVGVATAADLLEQTVRSTRQTRHRARSIFDEAVGPVRKPSGATQIPVQNTDAISD